MAKEMKYHLICPYCHRGELLSDGKAPITLSARCPVCGGFYRCDMENLKTEKSKAQRRQSRR